MKYQCSECGREIGLMADKYATPQLYKCPHTGRVAELQTPRDRFVREDKSRPSQIDQLNTKTPNRFEEKHDGERATRVRRVRPARS